MSSVDVQPGGRDRAEAEWLATFLDRYYADEIRRLATGDRDTLHVDMTDLVMYVDDASDADAIAEDAEHYQQVLEAAAHMTDASQDALGDVTVGLVDAAGGSIEHYGVAELNADRVREFIGVTGQLAAVTKVREFPEVATFACDGCGIRTQVNQDTREFQPPQGVACECENSPRWEFVHGESEWTDHRKLKIQQPPEQAANGESQYVTAHVFGANTSDKHGVPLTERVGQDVTVYGRVELVQQDGRNAADYLFTHYLMGHAVTFEEKGLEAVNVDDHREEIRTHADAEDVYERFYTSLAPQIHPTDQMELAMQVSAAYLFAAPRIDPDGGPMYRGDLHAAIIGDPGMAKSVLLSGVAEFSPDAEHRSATGLSSDVGLVAAAVDDDFGEGGWTLKPGILVRAGCHAVIDEIDKGPDDLEKINDALEGRQIASIDKAGMKADLKTRTGLLVSGNPEGSRFNAHEPLPPQINVDESLLTRFDAIVMLIDEVDEQQDREIASHITESFMEGVAMERGKQTEQQATDRPVSPEVGRAWVALGRRLTPKLTPDAAEQLEEFYVDARTANDDGDETISATARQLEGGIRFAMAFARMRLSETVEQQDVDMAIQVSRALIGQTFDADEGHFDIDKLTTSKATSSQDERITAIMNALTDATDALTPAEVADATGLDEQTARDQLETLHRDGRIIEPRTGVYANV